MRIVATLVLAMVAAAAPVAKEGRTVAVDGPKQLQQAIASAKPGDTIRLAPGNYGSMHIAGPRGTAERPVVIESADAKSPAVFGDANSGLHLIAPQHVTLRGITVRNVKTNGINIDDGGKRERPARGVRIENVRVEGVGPKGNCDGIKLSGLDDFRVTGCTVIGWGGSGVDMVGCHDGLIEDCTFRGKEGFSQSNAVQIKGGCRDVTVRNCLMVNTGHRGVNLGGSTGRPYFRPPLEKMGAEAYEAANCVVEGCRFIGGQAAVAFVSQTDCVARFNTIYRPERFAFRILQESTGKPFVPSRRGVIERNVIVWRSDELRSVLNIGPNVDVDSFVFRANAWYCEDRPEQSLSPAPVAEELSSYGIDPKLKDPAKEDLTVGNRRLAKHIGVEALPSDAKPAEAKGTPVIAAWDVVPHQVIDKPFTVGVVAFHENPVVVEFTVFQNDREVNEFSTLLEKPRLKERVNVWEFYITIDPSKLSDGPFEVRARTASPVSGVPVTDLKPMLLYASSGGTLKFNPPVWADCAKGEDEAGDGTEGKPFKTIRRALKAAGDGGTVYLKAGKSYSAKGLGGGKKRTYWTTITAAPGVKRDDVEIGPGRTGTEKLRFKNITLYSDPPKRGYNTILSGENGSTIVWVDGCKMYNRKGRWGGGGNLFGNRYVGYVTGGITTEMDNGPGGVLVRNHKIHKITSDALTNARTAINCEVRDIDPGKTGAHPDWHQSYTGGKDKKTGELKYKTCIIYNCSGLSCQSQGFFGHNLKDSAFVNCIFHKLPGHALSQYSGHMDHVLWLHCTVPNQSWLWRGTLRGDNCYVLNGLFLNMQEAQGGDASGFTISHNHFITGKRSLGESKTTGDAQFVDAGNLDFHVKATSPAARSGTRLQCVPADIDGKPRDAKSPTRGCYVCPEPKPQD